MWVLMPRRLAGKVGFKVITAVYPKMAVFWFVTPCSLIHVNQSFSGRCCLHNQGIAGKVIDKTNSVGAEGKIQMVSSSRLM